MENNHNSTSQQTHNDHQNDHQNQEPIKINEGLFIYSFCIFFTESFVRRFLAISHDIRFSLRQKKREKEKEKSSLLSKSSDHAHDI